MEKLRRRAMPVRELGALAISHAGDLALGLISALLFTRFTAAATYADFGYAVSLLGLAALTGWPGFGTAVTRAAAQGLDGALAEATRIRLRGSFLGSTGLLVWAWVLRDSGRVDTAVVIGGCAVLLPLLGPGSGVLAHLLGKGRFVAYATANLAVETLKTAALVVATLVLQLDGPPAALAPLAAAGLGYLALSLLLTPRGQRSTGREFRSLGRTLTLAATLASAAAQLDRLIIGTWFDPATMAAYTLAFTLTDPLRGFGTLAGKFLMPRLVNVDTRAPTFRRRFGAMLLALAGAVVLLVTAFWLVFPVVQPRLFPGYSPSVAFARWLIVATALSIFNTVTAQALWGLGTLRAVTMTQLTFPIQRIALLAVGVALGGVEGILVAQVTHSLLASAVLLFCWLRAR